MEHEPENESVLENLPELEVSRKPQVPSSPMAGTNPVSVSSYKEVDVSE